MRGPFRIAARRGLCLGVSVALLAVSGALFASAQEAAVSVTLTPDSDTAPSGTCNEFTARVTRGFEVQTPMDQVIVDVRQTLDGAGTEPGESRELSFCTPLDPQGPNPVSGPTNANQNPSFGGPTQFGDVLGNNPGETAGDPGRNTSVHADVGPTDSNGEVTFGISMTPEAASGTVTVLVWVDPTDDDAYDEGEAFDSSTKTWVVNEGLPVTSLDADPEAVSVQNGGQHQVTVTVRNGNNPLSGVTPSSMVLSDGTGRPGGDAADPNSGPSPNFTGNADPYSCTSSNAQGASTCTFQDSAGTGPGTDTVVFFVDEGGAPGADQGDPQDAVQVAWFQPQQQPPPPTATPTPTPGPATPEARNIRLCHGTTAAPVCDTSPATREPGDEHFLTVRVTDQDGDALSGVPVELRETGPAGFLPGGNSILVTTGAAGTAGATLSTQELGSSSIVAEISPPGSAGSRRGPGAADDECEQPAGPGGAPAAGNCVSGPLEVSWVAVECSDGLDNDDDGFVDLEDPACTSEEDTSEAPVNLVHHDRRTNMRFRDWMGPGDEGLVIFGRLRLTDEDDEFLECAHRQPMLIQRRDGGEWKTVKEAKTNATGRWTGVVFDVPGPYRAVAPRVEIQVDDVLHVCFSAHKVKTHHHRR